MFSTKVDLSKTVGKEIPSSRGRPTQMLTGITKIKLPPSTKEDEEMVKLTSLQRCNTGKAEVWSRTPAASSLRCL